MSICPNALAPLSEACGGGGVCVDAHTCLCPPGWSGRGDFVFGEPNCNIYLDAIRYEWVVVLLLRLLLLFAALNSARKSVHQNKLSGKPFFQSVSFGFSLGFAVDALAFGACAILKIIHPETQIGQDPGVTVAFVVGFFGFGAGMSLFMFAFVELNSKSLRYRNASFQDKFDKAIAGLKFQLFTSTTWALFCGALPLFMLACTSDEAIFGLALVHYIGMSAIIVIYGYWFVPKLLTPMEADIEGVLASNVQSNLGEQAKLKRLLARIKFIVKTTTQNSLPNMIPAVFFGCWPFLQSCTSYWLPVTWSISALVCLATLQVSQPNQEKRRCCGGVLTISLFSPQHDSRHLSQDPSALSSFKS